MTRRTGRFLAPACLLGLLLAGAPAEAQRYDPRLSFSSLDTAHFTIHFHPGQEALASRLAALAEEVHGRLARDFPDSGTRHTQVILADQHDLANGWATPLPFNTIELSVAAPDPSSSIGYTDDWLRLVFTHEYVHILHLDRSRGLFGGLRRIFGRAPLLFPNIFLPGWATEGLATYVETAETGTGRVNAGDFRLIVDAAARAKSFEPIDRVSGALVDWPAGDAPYAYGSRFHEYLAARYGEGTFARLADATAGRVPYAPGGAYKQVFNRSAQELWRDFEETLQVEEPARGQGSPARPPVAQPVRVTSHGFVVSGPRWTPDGSSLVYSLRHPHDFPALMAVVPGQTPTRLASRYLGERASVTASHVFFDQREFVSSVALQSDLYAVERSSGRVQRLTRGRRASSPDMAPDGRSLAAVLEGDGRSRLVTFPVLYQGARIRLGAAATLADGPETQFAAPRWSPDGARLAAERRRLGRRPDVVVFDVATGAILFHVEGEDGRVTDPEWLPGGQGLIVSWERPRRAFNLFLIDLTSRRARPLVETASGARAATVTPDGARLAFVGYTPEGFDLFTAPFDPGAAGGGGAEPELQLTPGAGDPGADPAAPVPPSRPYSPARTILPRFWMPVAGTDDDRLELGAATVGVDALGRHGYAAAVWWSDRARPDWQASYVYSRWRPALFVSASDDRSEWQGDEIRERTVEAGVRLPFRTVRRTQVLYGSLHGTREVWPAAVFERRAIRGAYEVVTARRYGYSISPEEGLRAGVAAEVTRRGLGSGSDGATVTGDFRAYPRWGGAHRVLALRLAGGASFGDAGRLLGAGGPAAPPSVMAFGRDAIGLARGFEAGEIAGRRALVVNLDYRMPLVRVERGVRTWPILLRQIHAAAFVDAAHAWRDSLRVEDVRVSAGLEISSDLVLGHALPLTATGGIALRRDPAGRREGAALFGRIGYAF